MKAVVFDGTGGVKLSDVPTPDIEEGQDALIRVTHSSICGSDINILRGKIVVEADAIMGHEGAGVVEKVGPDVKRFKPGDRVVISYSVQCGECESCRRGLLTHCEKGGQLGHGAPWGGYGGTQAEYLRIPWADANLQLIPDSLSTEQALFVGDILSTGYQAVEQGSVQKGDTVAVFGAGPVGLCAVAAAGLFAPSKIVSVDMVDYRLEAAKRFGADHAINAGRIDVVEEIKRLTGGKGVDVAIEAIGSVDAFESLFETVAPAGRISVVGVFPFDKVGISLRQLLRRSMRIAAGRANLIHMGLLLKLIEAGRLDMTPLITHRMRLGQAVEAYRIFGTQSDDSLKILLEP